MDISLDSALSGYAQQAGVTSFPAFFFKFFLNFFFIQIISNHEEKGHTGKFIVAMLMSTNPSIIPGINHFCLLGLAPASTMVRVSLERSATEASCPTKYDLIIDG